MTDKGPKPFFDTEFIGALAELLDGARKQKAIYDAYVEAGFTEKQALYMVGKLFNGHRSDS